jgi:hypothetical protein
LLTVVEILAIEVVVEKYKSTTSKGSPMRVVAVSGVVAVLLVLGGVVGAVTVDEVTVPVLSQLEDAEDCRGRAEAPIGC